MPQVQNDRKQLATLCVEMPTKLATTLCQRIDCFVRQHRVTEQGQATALALQAGQFKQLCSLTPDQKAVALLTGFSGVWLMLLGFQGI